MLVAWLGLMNAKAGVLNAELRATRLVNAVPILSRLLEEPVLIESSLKNDLITFRFHQVSVDEAKTRIASAINATWVRTEKGLLLRQTPQQIQADLDEVKASVRENAISAVEELKRHVGAARPFDAQAASKLHEGLKAWIESGRTGVMPPKKLSYGPNFSFTKGVLSRITPEMLLKVTPSKRFVVFSNRPTRAELELPYRVDDHIQELLSGNQLWMQATNGKGYIETRSGNFGFSGYGIERHGADRWDPPLEKQALTVMLRFSNLYQQGDIQATVSLHNEVGEELVSQSVSLTPAGVAEDAKVSEIQEPAFPLVWSKRAKEYIDWLKAPAYDRHWLSEELKNHILNPEKFEADQDTTFEIARHLARDRSFIVHNVGGWSTLPTLSALRSDPNVVVEEADRWLTLRPKLRSEARRLRPDPEILGPMLRRAVNQISMTIDQQADFAFSLPGSWDETRVYLSRIDRVRPIPIEPFNGFQVLRFYGSLPAQTRATLQNGDGMLVRNLGTASQRELWKLVFEDNYGTFLARQKSFSSSGGTDLERKTARNNWRKSVSTLQRIPTRAFPSGLPEDMKLTIPVSSTSEKLLVYGLKSARMETTTPEGLGRWLGIQKNKGSRSDPSEYVFDQDRVGLFNEREINLQFETSDGRIGTYRLVDFNSPFTQLMKLQELPEAIQKEIRAGEADWLAKAAAWDARQKSGGPPPPPL